MTTYNDYKTIIPPVSLGHIIDPQRPILFYCKTIKDAMCSDSHSHPRGQFIYSSRGVTRVVTAQGVYLIPCSQAFWCPPNHQHTLYFLGEVTITNLFIDPSCSKKLPDKLQVVDVSPLLKELILKAVNINTDYSNRGKEHRLMEVILDEISELKSAPLTLPWSEDSKLMPIMQAIFNEPTNAKNIVQWADLSYVSSRTLARLFKKEVNMTFSEWRMQARLFYALEKLYEGKSVTYISLELGYSTPSAFISAFRKLLGKSPLEYMAADKG